MLALRRLSREHRNLQEVIVQNFRAKPDTAMRVADDLSLPEYLAAVATARVVLGPGMRIQAPPNLSEPGELAALLAAGVDDWGGVSPLTPDHVNPERPWPQLEELARLTADAGVELRERLTIHPEYVLAAEHWLDPRLRPQVEALASPDGLAVEGLRPSGRPWQESEGTQISRPSLAVAAQICPRPSTPRAAVRIDGAISTRSTVTGSRPP
jgi:FO synthase